MKKGLTYKGYSGTVEFSAEDEVLHGSVIAINDLITYEGESVEEIKKEFELAVDDYLAYCKEIGKSPDKPYKGMFNVRVSSEIHKSLDIVAKRQDLKLNTVVSKAVEYLLKHEEILQEKPMLND